MDRDFLFMFIGVVTVTYASRVAGLYAGGRELSDRWQRILAYVPIGAFASIVTLGLYRHGRRTGCADPGCNHCRFTRAQGQTVVALPCQRACDLRIDQISCILRTVAREHTLHAESTFTVSDFNLRDGEPEIETGVQFGDIDMVKQFSGDITGKAITRFFGGQTASGSCGIYVAYEAFEGSIAGRSGSFVFVHSQTMVEKEITAMMVQIGPGSGTGDLTGISGSGGIRVEPDGTHRLLAGLRTA